MYSPAAIDKAPASRPARPASRITWLEEPAPAMPRTREKLDTSPSLAPNTAARNQPEARARARWARPATTSACACSSAAMAAVASGSRS
jgi:hypothetical protein